MRKKTYLKLVEYQTEQSEKHLSEVRSIHKEMRGYKHDFHHHLQALKGQLEAGEIERALSYIAQLDDQLMNVDTLLKTGNVSLDAILSLCVQISPIPPDFLAQMVRHQEA